MGKAGTKPNVKSSRPIWQILLSAFCGGVGSCILLLAAAAFLLTHTPLPLAAVRPLACIAAAVGAAVSAAILARQRGENLLLCGVCCGIFYVLCLSAATLAANGTLDWQGANAMLPLAILLGAMLGSAVVALRGSR